jgi:hypothetical protein
VEPTTKQPQAVETLQPTGVEARPRLDRLDHPTTYWGVSCRGCSEVVAFDVAPYTSFGPRAASTRPGAIRCSLGHSYVYFPGDFQFLASSVAISDEVMRKNRDAFQADNPARPTRAQYPRPFVRSVVHVAAFVEGLLGLATLNPNPRKVAETAAQGSWAEWATRKAG